MNTDGAGTNSSCAHSENMDKASSREKVSLGNVDLFKTLKLGNSENIKAATALGNIVLFLHHES